jgi:hypothetical protein
MVVGFLKVPCPNVQGRVGLSARVEVAGKLWFDCIGFRGAFERQMECPSAALQRNFATPFGGKPIPSTIARSSQHAVNDDLVNHTKTAEKTP